MISLLYNNNRHEENSHRHYVNTYFLLSGSFWFEKDQNSIKHRAATSVRLSLIEKKSVD
jgi:hypothetical protein